MAGPPTLETSADRRTRTGSLTAALVPPFAWLVAFGAAYVVQDFTCSAAASAARPRPEDTVRLVVLGIYAVALVAIVVAGLLGRRLAQQMADARPAGPWWFLSWVAMPLAFVFGGGTALLAWTVVVLEVCV